MRDDDVYHPTNEFSEEAINYAINDTLLFSKGYKISWKRVELKGELKPGDDEKLVNDSSAWGLHLIDKTEGKMSVFIGYFEGQDTENTLTLTLNEQDYDLAQTFDYLKTLYTQVYKDDLWYKIT